MRRSSWLLCLLFAALASVACTKGNECDECGQDSDCKGGLICVNFLDDNGNVAGKRCGSGVGATTCRVR